MKNKRIKKKKPDLLSKIKKSIDKYYKNESKKDFERKTFWNGY